MENKEKVQKVIDYFEIPDDLARELSELLTKQITKANDGSLAQLNKMKFKKTDRVVVNLSGRGDKDLATYMKFL